MFLLVIVGLALLVASMPILRAATQVQANIRSFNQRAKAAQGRVVDHDVVNDKRFPIVVYTPEGGESVRVAGMAAADGKDLAIGTKLELLYDPDALGDVSFVGLRDERALVGPLKAIGYVLVTIGVATFLGGVLG